MSSINYDPKSVLLSNISIDPQILLGGQQAGKFFSISEKYNSKLKKKLLTQKSMDMIYNMRMKTETKAQKDKQVKEEKARKTKKDKQGRIFKCGGCPNQYLSYPALYTHIKTKHGGITPQGTMRGQNGKVKKRGRPKTRRNVQTLYERQSFESQFPKILLNLVDKQKLSVLDEQNQQKEEENNPDLSEKIFVSELRQLIKMQKPVLRTLPIVAIMTIFLYNIKDFVDYDTLLSFQRYFQRFIKFINKNAHKILTQFADETGLYIQIQNNKRIKTQKQPISLKNKQQKAPALYCSVQLPKFIPVFAQSYIRTLQGTQNENKLENLLGDFCRWLLEMKFTNLSLLKSSSLFKAVIKNEQQAQQ